MLLEIKPLSLNESEDIWDSIQIDDSVEDLLLRLNICDSESDSHFLGQKRKSPEDENSTKSAESTDDSTQHQPGVNNSDQSVFLVSYIPNEKERKNSRSVSDRPDNVRNKVKNNYLKFLKSCIDLLCKKFKKNTFSLKISPQTKKALNLSENKGTKEKKFPRRTIYDVLLKDNENRFRSYGKVTTLLAELKEIAEIRLIFNMTLYDFFKIYYINENKFINDFNLNKFKYEIKYHSISELFQGLNERLKHVILCEIKSMMKSV